VQVINESVSSALFRVTLYQNTTLWHGYLFCPSEDLFQNVAGSKKWRSQEKNFFWTIISLYNSTHDVELQFDFMAQVQLNLQGSN